MAIVIGIVLNQKNGSPQSWSRENRYFRFESNSDPTGRIRQQSISDFWFGSDGKWFRTAITGSKFSRLTFLCTKFDFRHLVTFWTFLLSGANVPLKPGMCRLQSANLGRCIRVHRSLLSSCSSVTRDAFFDVHLSAASFYPKKKRPHFLKTAVRYKKPCSIGYFPRPIGWHWLASRLLRVKVVSWF